MKLLNPTHLLAAATAFALASAASAQDRAFVASPWTAVDTASVRLLLPAKPAATGDQQRLFGIDLRLRGGDKTYWRSPGETGVAPTFSFAGSEGVADVEALYPAPKAFDDGAGGIAYGYVGGTVFPVRFRQTAPDATLVVKFDFGICTKNTCIPASATLRGSPGKGWADAEADEEMTGAIKQVPVAHSFGAGGPLAIETAAIHAGADRETISVTVRAPSAPPPELFIEADEPFTHPQREMRAEGWYFTATRPLSSPSQPTGATPTMRLTVTAGGKAIETELTPAKEAK